MNFKTRSKTEETRTEVTKTSDVKDSTAAFEEVLAKTEGGKEEGKYILRFYVAGMGPKLLQAIDNRTYAVEI